jgi:hypothetical protein
MLVEPLIVQSIRLTYEFCHDRRLIYVLDRASANVINMYYSVSRGVLAGQPMVKIEHFYF